VTEVKKDEIVNGKWRIEKAGSPKIARFFGVQRENVELKTTNLNNL